MGEKTNSSESVFFVMVPKVGSMVAHHSILVSQTKAMIDPSTGVQLCDEATDELTPDGRGIIRLNTNHPNHKARMKVLSMKMERENLGGRPPVLLGPFDDESEAFAKMHDARPKTPEEAVAISTLKLKSAEVENAALRDVIKQMESAGNKKSGAN